MIYSQNNEEAIIAAYFNDRKGTLLDIGANDGETFSNSRALLKDGWRGVLVEPSKEPYHNLMELYLLRPDVYCFNIAIGNVDGEVDFYESGSLLGAGDTSLVSTLVQEETKRWAPANINFQTKKAQCRTWKYFLELSPLKQFDLILIDVEGMERDILRQIDFTTIGAKMIVVEWNGNHLDEFNSLIAPFGYDLVHKNPENLIYTCRRPVLSVLMPSIPLREFSYQILRAEVERQAAAASRAGLGRVEIIADTSKRFLDGGKSIGRKRNDLLKAATGEYVAFLDDDDNIFPNYIEEILRAAAAKDDAIGMKSLYRNSKYVTIIEMSGMYSENDQVSPGGTAKRTIWHCCPIKTEIAQSEEFNETNYDEDWDWLKRILPKIKSHSFIDRIIHQYNELSGQSEAVKINAEGYK